MLQQAAEVLAVLAAVTPALQEAGADTTAFSDAAATLETASTHVSDALADYSHLAEGAPTHS